MTMKMVGLAEPLTSYGFKDACDELGTVAPVLWAVLRVETSGRGFSPDRRQTIRFEPHIFERFTGKLAPAARGDNQVAQWNRLRDGMAIDREQALMATSFGIGQIMGFNAGMVGYKTAGVEGMIASFADYEDAQLAALVQYCLKTGADRELQQLDWGAFARLYNGPAYMRNNYAEKLALAFATAANKPPSIEVRRQQMELSYAGLYDGPMDGLRGPAMAAALAKVERSVA